MALYTGRKVYEADRSTGGTAAGSRHVPSGMETSSEEKVLDSDRLVCGVGRPDGRVHPVLCRLALAGHTGFRVVCGGLSASRGSRDCASPLLPF